MSPPSGNATEPPAVAEVVELVRRLGRAMSAPDATVETVARSVGDSVTDRGPSLGARATVAVEGIDDVSVTQRWDTDEANAATIRLARPIVLADLEDLLGPSRPVPPTPGGTRHVVLPEAAAEGAAWTALAELDAEAVIAITIRSD